MTILPRGGGDDVVFGPHSITLLFDDTLPTAFAMGVLKESLDDALPGIMAAAAAAAGAAAVSFLDDGLTDEVQAAVTVDWIDKGNFMGHRNTPSLRQAFLIAVGETCRCCAAVARGMWDISCVCGANGQSSLRLRKFLEVMCFFKSRKAQDSPRHHADSSTTHDIHAAIIQRRAGVAVDRLRWGKESAQNGSGNLADILRYRGFRGHM